MNTKNHSGEYVAPEIGIIETNSQGVLCASGKQNDQFNYNNNPGWFN